MEEHPLRRVHPSSELVKGTTGKPLCQELLINLTGPSGKLEYMPTDQGHPPPLTLAACHPEWDDYLDLTETVTEMAHRLMKEDRQEVATPPKASTLRKMATSIVDLEDGYFRALHEVIVETKRALWDVSHIDTHYVSQVVTVMSSWQEVVQTAASHMEGVDTTIYITRHEDA